MKSFFRLIGIGFLRFVALVTLGVGISNFEVSPLPEWTLMVFAFIASAFLTYVFTRWAFHPRHPTTSDALWVLAIFLLVGTAWELLVYSTIGWIMGVPFSVSFMQVFSWRSFFILAFHGLVILFTFWHARRVHRMKAAAEGLI